MAKQILFGYEKRLFFLAPSVQGYLERQRNLVNFFLLHARWRNALDLIVTSRKTGSHCEEIPIRDAFCGWGFLFMLNKVRGRAPGDIFSDVYKKLTVYIYIYIYIAL